MERAWSICSYSPRFVILCLPFINCLSEGKDKLSTDLFLKALADQSYVVETVSENSIPSHLQAFTSAFQMEFHDLDGFIFACGISTDEDKTLIDVDSNLTVLRNRNLLLIGSDPIPIQIERIFHSLKPPLGLNDLGIFFYPLAICFIVSIFITSERAISLRSELTFPVKVEKALLSGNLNDPKWTRKSSAERIVWFAKKENPSSESIRAYTTMEISVLERGLFLLEVIVSGAPLVGLLGTVTGLVQVFSVMPSTFTDEGIFSQGIALALLTTIAGLAIAIPSLVAHSYFIRLVEKRAVSLNWLTAKMIESTKAAKSVSL